jgi:tetratricopeptide (TPR) repeat protein
LFVVKRFTITLAAVVFFSLPLASLHPVSAKDVWTSVRSKNFLLVGNDSEKKLREVALRLEQFREVSARLFTSINFTSPVPTTVIVFKSDSSYQPFKPTARTAGYFQAGSDVNYITMTTQLHPGQDPLSVIFHEYTHLLVNNTMGNVPTWFNEGLAEYYSTFSITADQKVVLGEPVANHHYILRNNKLLPLRTLLQVDHDSPYYNGNDKEGIFYAESWALVHYLILGNDGRRLQQLSKFLELVEANVPLEQAFPQAFQTTFEKMEGELRDYIGRNRYPITWNKFAFKSAVDTEMKATPISEAEAQAYFGDLLLHSNRAEAESYLQRALALDPQLAMANASLGMLRARQHKLADAREYLDRALAANPQNYLVHYYYAYVLSREGMDESQIVSEYEPKTAARIRAELDKAIELRPDYPESYSLLAFINLVTVNHLDESIAMLKRVLATSPGRKDLLFMLAQIHSRKGEYQTARQILEPLTLNNSALQLRQQAKELLAQQTLREEQAARLAAVNGSGANGGPGETTEVDGSGNQRFSAAKLSDTEPVTPLDLTTAMQMALEPVLRKPEDGETRVQGSLVGIECDGKGIIFVVKLDDHVIRLHADRFDSVLKVAFSAEPGRVITCGPRRPENTVVICYVPNSDKTVRFDGTIKSVEFVPKEFKLKA